MLKIPLLPSEYSSQGILFFLTSCCTVNTIFKSLRSISLREEEGKLSLIIQLSSMSIKKRRNKKKARKKNRKTLFEKKKTLFCQ